MKAIIRYGICTILMATALSLVSCGGGGDGDSEFVGAARVKLKVTPTDIDVGDRMLVTAEITRINEDGIILKFRYPDGLEYVLDSAILEIDGDEIDIAPAVNTLSGNEVYLVFFNEAEPFKDAKRGTFSFQLEGTADISSGEVEVDVDVNDSQILDVNEFDAENPEFQVEEFVEISVEG